LHCSAGKKDIEGNMSTQFLLLVRSFYRYIAVFFVALFCLGFYLRYANAQIKISSDESIGAEKFSTTTFETVDAYIQTVENYNNNQAVLDKLDQIILRLDLIRNKK
jgi:hypothetical protein